MTLMPPEQHNYGSGLMAGRDINIKTISKEAENLLSKLAKDAPELADLLRTALDEGVIKPDIAIQLASAARSINEDVAHQLYSASRYLNEDVANSLRYTANLLNEDVASSLHDSAEHINDSVATRISSTSADLRVATRELDRALERARGVDIAEWSRIVNSMDDAAQNVIFASQQHQQTAQRWSWRSFGWGAVACIVVFVTLLVLWTVALQN